jgi:hypothetical protein
VLVNFNESDIMSLKGILVKLHQEMKEK